MGSPHYNMLTFLYLLGFCFLLVLSQDVSELKDSAISELSSGELEDFVGSASDKSVKLVYFINPGSDDKDGKKQSGRSYEGRVLNIFLKVYEKAAVLLKDYGVKVAKVMCAQEKDAAEKYCTHSETSQNVYSFSKGRQLLALKLDNMFDIDAVISNTLQLVLLHEAPILVSEKELNTYMSSQKGQNNVILAYHHAIGTREHRAVMEVAYLYSLNGGVKFLITTELDVLLHLDDVETDEENALWLLQCKEVKEPEPCGNVKYRDNIDFSSLARFLRVLNMTGMHDVSKDGEMNPYEAHAIHSAILYYDKTSMQKVTDIGSDLVHSLQGHVGVLLVDVDGSSADRYGYTKGRRVPGAAFLPGHSVQNPELRFMETDFAEDGVHDFIVRKLQRIYNYTKSVEPERAIDPIEEVETQDDQVAEAVTRNKDKEICREYIPALTDKTFPTQTQNTDLLVVLFYLTFDAVSMAFLHSYSSASHVLAKDSLYPLAAVDCYDWTDVCGKNNITTYPTIRIYRKGQTPLEYKGLLDGPAIVSTVKLLLARSPVELHSSEEVTHFLEGSIPAGSSAATSISVLGIFPSHSHQALSAFKNAAKDAEGKHLYGFVVGDPALQIKKSFDMEEKKMPGLVVARRHDHLQRHAVYNDEMTMDKIHNFVQQASLPVFPELTPINFPSYYARGRPFVILFGEDLQIGEGISSVVGDIALSNKFPQVNFAWMNLMKSDGVAGRVLQEHHPDADPPTLLLINHQKGTVHVLERELSSEKITTWLEGALNEEVPPTKSLAEGEWKPLNEGYDYLKMMDEDMEEAAMLHNAHPHYEPEGDEEEDYEEEEESAPKNTRLFHSPDHKHKQHINAAPSTGKSSKLPPETGEPEKEQNDHQDKQQRMEDEQEKPKTPPHGGEL